MKNLFENFRNFVNEETRDTYAKFDMKVLDKILEDIFEEENDIDPA